MDFDKCSEVSKSKRISASEHKMKFYIKNKNRITVRKVVVDGCLIDDDRQRCDYLFEINEPLAEVIYLELKGRNIAKAFKQLESTIDICSYRHHKARRICHIVASRVPKFGTEIQKLKKKFFEKNRVSVNVDTMQTEVII